jgi:methylthioxylose transferase
VTCRADNAELPGASRTLAHQLVLPFVFAVTVALIGVAIVWGRRLEHREPRIKLGAAPFVGRWHAHVSIGIVPAILLAALIAGFSARVCALGSDRWLVLLSATFSTLFTFSLAASDGLSKVLAPVVDPTEYWANLETLPKATDLLFFHSTEAFLVDRSVHMKGHPPGFVLLLKGLAAIGLGAPWVTGALSFLGVAMTLPAVALTVRALCGAQAMRSCLPFLTVAPFAVWMGTSADAFYAGIGAWGVACAALGIRDSRSRRRVALGAASGLLLSASLFLTYGAATLLPLGAILVVTGVRARWRAFVEFGVSAVATAAAVTLAYRHYGFWWFDGLRLTNKFYWIGSAHFRTWTYFLLANVAVLAIAIGPAVVAGIVRLRNRRVWVIVGAALACITVAELSQYSKGEVERIWLLFMPWLVPATSSLSDRRGSHPNRWLTAQAVVAIGLQVTLRSKW